jgi:hypothetical protein
MAAECDQVLLLAADAVLLRHLLRGLPHRHAGRGLGDAGASGTRSRGRNPENARSRAPSDSRPARLANMPRHPPAVQHGTSETLSAPPAIHASRGPPDLQRHLAIASFADAQARFTCGGDSRRQPAARARPRGEVRCPDRRDDLPIATVSTEAGSILGALHLARGRRPCEVDRGEDRGTGSLSAEWCSAPGEEWPRGPRRLRRMTLVDLSAKLPGLPDRRQDATYPPRALTPTAPGAYRKVMKVRVLAGPCRMCRRATGLPGGVGS